MKQRLWTKNFSAMSVAIGAMIFAAGPLARADVLYRTDDGTFGERFNDSETTETEDNWVGNGYVVVTGGTHLVSIQYPLGETFVNQPVTALIYQGCDVTDACACGGLYKLEQVDTTISGAQLDTVTIPLTTPVDLSVGDVFFAALVIRNVDGGLFPFLNQTMGTVLNHSFFDVGPQQGAFLDLDVTSYRITVNGGTHPVVDSGVQSPGNTHLRVNATP